MKALDPVRSFPEFYSNPAVQQLASQSRWTVTDSELVPINIRRLLRTGKVEAAYEVGDSCLTTLRELTQQIPNAANAAFYLRANTDRIAAVSTDGSCPKRVSHELMRLPRLYVEHSMNGRGHLLLVPLPESADDLSATPGGTVLREAHGHYEVTLEGWVTFSRDTLRGNPSPALPRSVPAAPQWDDIFRRLSGAQEIPHAKVAARLEEPRLSQVVDLVTCRPLSFDFNDAGGNVAAYEHAVLGELYERIHPILQALQKADPATNLSHTVEVAVLYAAALRMLPHRGQTDHRLEPEPLLIGAVRAAIEQHAVLGPTPKRKSR